MAEGPGTWDEPGLSTDPGGWVPVFSAGPEAHPHQSEAKSPAATSSLNRAWYHSLD